MWDYFPYLLLLFLGLLIGTIFSSRFKRAFPPRIMDWAHRVGPWTARVWKSKAATEDATFRDLLVLAGFFVTALTIFFGLRETRIQATRDYLEIESRRLHEVVAAQQQQIHEHLDTIKTLEAEQQVPQLKKPTRDAQIIGQHVDLEWEYKGHNEFTNYMIQVVRLSDRTQSPPQAIGSSESEFDQSMSEPFPATDPGGKRSRFPPEIGGLRSLPAGTYYWRVVPVDFSITPGEDLNRSKIADWSAFSSFTVYPTIKQRIVATHKVLVGTNFVQDTAFSRRAKNGEAEGFDMDLIRVIVEGCLDRDEQKGVAYNETRCKNAVDKYIVNYEKSPPNKFERIASVLGDPKQLKLEIRPIADWKEWLGMLQRKEIDMFIGSATRAKSRERGDVEFTPGYYKYDTVMLVKENEPAPDIAALARKGMKVGVIEGTTNHWLANLLLSEVDLKAGMRIIPFNSFPALDGALDRGDVDAVIVDNTLAAGLTGLKELHGLRSYPAWNKYMENDQYIGYPAEEFAVAIAHDARKDEGVALLEQVKLALQGDPIKKLLVTLKQEYHLE